MSSCPTDLSLAPRRDGLAGALHVPLRTGVSLTTLLAGPDEAATLGIGSDNAPSERLKR